MFVVLIPLSPGLPLSWSHLLFSFARGGPSGLNPLRTVSGSERCQPVDDPTTSSHPRDSSVRGKKGYPSLGTLVGRDADTDHLQ